MLLRAGPALVVSHGAHDGRVTITKPGETSTMPASTDKTFDQLCQYTRQTAMYGSIMALLEWDERTIMPPAQGEYRAEQVTLLSRTVHERETAPEVGGWLAELAESALAKDPASDPGATIRQLKRRYEKK